LSQEIKQEYIFGLPIAEGSNRQTVDELIEKQKKLQATIDVLTETEESRKRKIQQLYEKQKRLLDIIDKNTNTEESNKRTIKELREKLNHLQANITDQTKAMAAMKQALQVSCGEQENVSTRKVEAITTVNGPKSHRLSI
jgi:chromosome segregation ATPase